MMSQNVQPDRFQVHCMFNPIEWKKGNMASSNERLNKSIRHITLCLGWASWPVQAEGTGQAAKAQGACQGKSFGTWHVLTSGPEWGCVMGPKWRVGRLARRVGPGVLGGW